MAFLVAETLTELVLFALAISHVHFCFAIDHFLAVHVNHVIFRIRPNCLLSQRTFIFLIATLTSAASHLPTSFLEIVDFSLIGSVKVERGHPNRSRSSY